MPTTRRNKQLDFEGYCKACCCNFIHKFCIRTCATALPVRMTRWKPCCCIWSIKTSKKHTPALHCSNLQTATNSAYEHVESALGGHVERNEVQSKHPRERTHCEHRQCVAKHCLFFIRFLSRGSFDVVQDDMFEAADSDM